MVVKKNNRFVQELTVVQSSQNLVGALTSPKTRRKKVAQNIYKKKEGKKVLLKHSSVRSLSPLIHIQPSS